MNRIMKKIAVGTAVVGMSIGSLGAPAFADHNSGNGDKNGHDNGNANGHAKQDAKNNPAPPDNQADCEALEGEWVVGEFVGGFAFASCELP